MEYPTRNSTTDCPMLESVSRRRASKRITEAIQIVAKQTKNRFFLSFDQYIFLYMWLFGLLHTTSN